MGTPLRTLVWLLLIATGLAIYREAETLVAHVFSVVLLFVFASIIAVVLTPLIDLVQRVRGFRSHRGLAVFLLYLLLAGIIVGLGFLIVPTLVAQARQLPELTSRVQTQLQSWGVNANLDAIRKSVAGVDLTAQLGLVGGVINTLISVVLAVVISIYLAIEGRALVATLRNLFPAHTRMFDFTALAVGSTVERYVRGQFLMSILIGAYTGVAMALLGVHYAVVLGVAAALLELVPIAGAIIALALAAAVALLQSPGLGVAALAVGVLGHSLEAYVLGPRISGRVTQLHPLVAMSALLIGGEVGGILGALFGVPIAAIANIVLGAVYRSKQGDAALSTHPRGKIKAEDLPRLSDEIGGVDRDGVVSDPVPREKRSK
jgi:predicted PurR-regulated permease PerM